jgi:hypothetical protein
VSIRTKEGANFSIFRVTLPKRQKYELGHFQFKLKIRRIHNAKPLRDLRHIIIVLLTEVLAKMPIFILAPACPSRNPGCAALAQSVGLKPNVNPNRIIFPQGLPDAS